MSELPLHASRPWAKPAHIAAPLFMSRSDESSHPARGRDPGQGIGQGPGQVPGQDPDRTLLAPTSPTAAAKRAGAAGHLDSDVTVARTAHPAAAIASGVSSNVLPNGTRVAEFEINGVVGEGGFGVVYRAYDHLLRRTVALKEYMPSALAARQADLSVSVKSDQHRETFVTGLRSFINEAHLLAQFDHPALVKVFRFWEANSTAYMVMPLYEGGTLKQHLKARRDAGSGPPDEAWLRALLAPLLDALETLHRANCLHRDIAPDNILLIDGRLPLLLDFGAARRVIGEQTQALTVILKPGFAPIEQYDEIPGMKQGPWTDLYALAAVIHFAITGKPPPPSVGRLVHDQYQPLSQALGRDGFSHGTRYSAPLLALIDAALAPRPEARPQSAAEFRRRLALAPGAAAGERASAAAALKPINAPINTPINTPINAPINAPVNAPSVAARSSATAARRSELHSQEARAAALEPRKRAAFPALLLLGVCTLVIVVAVTLLLLDWRSARPMAAPSAEAMADAARNGAPSSASGANGATGVAESVVAGAGASGQQSAGPINAGPINTGPINTGHVNAGPVNAGPANTAPAPENVNASGSDGNSATLSASDSNSNAVKDARTIATAGANTMATTTTRADSASGTTHAVPASPPQAAAAEPEPRRALRRAEAKEELRRITQEARRSANSTGGVDGRGNSDVRPAWIGSRLREGRDCFAQSRYPCAIERADQVLAAEPGNGLAQELKRRAVTAQEAALSSDWKMH